MDPPLPPAGHKIVRNYDVGTTVAFNDSVLYTCEPGTFFASDLSKANFGVMCKSDGTWDEPSPWDICYEPSGT